MNRKIIFTIAKYLLAILLIIFGANKFLGFADVPPPEGETAQLFLTAMFSSYLAKFVGILEIIGGFLLLIPRTSFIGLLLLLPIVTNIVGFHLSHDMPGNGIWIFVMAMTFIIIIEFKEMFINLLIEKK